MITGNKSHINTVTNEHEEHHRLVAIAGIYRSSSQILRS